MTSISGILSDGSEYVKEGVVGKWQCWIMLIILMIVQTCTVSIVPLFSGYLVRVYGSTDEIAPDIDDYKRLFIDGWKLNIVSILYMIPAIIIAVVLGFLSVVPVITGIMSKGRIDEVAGLLLGSIGLLVAGVIFAVITLVMYMAYVHFSRSGRLMDAFSFGSILNQITNGVGWGTYIVMWIIIWIISMVLFFIIMGFNAIPPLGLLIGLILSPLWAVFIARVSTDIYDNRP
jgi:MFS family permease